VTLRRPKREVEYVTLSHVVNAYRRYPGETVIFHTRIDVLKPISNFQLGLDIHPGLEVVDFHAPDVIQTGVPAVEEIGEGARLTWVDAQNHAAGTRLDFEVHTVVKQNAVLGEMEAILECNTDLRVTTPDGITSDTSTSASVAVAPKGRYLKYLPSIYREDELMGRFVMLFESFWSPIESQITQIPYYFDPKLIPASLLPWLASWADLVLDDRWTPEKQRRLLGAIVSLYRKRGTRIGLERILEIYTETKPLIMEHRSNNLVLGPSAHLGPSIAMGKGNVPHTFTVTMNLPAVKSQKGEPLTGDELQRAEAERCRVIQSIIESEKPAHTRYSLVIKPIEN
jgi:phage tail-like protein